MEVCKIPGTNQRIYINRKGFNFGIDAILLSSFAQMKKGKSLIDIGTGSGILALRCKALYGLERVYGIEIQKEFAKMARRSVQLNDEEIQIIEEDMRKWDEKILPVDYIISNPPYLEWGKNIENKDLSMALCRQEIKMNLSDLFSFAKKKMKDKGILYLIHRPHRLTNLIERGKEFGFSLKRMRTVHSTKEEGAKMILLAFSKGGKDHLKIEAPLIIYEKGKYTKEVLQYYGELE